MPFVALNKDTQKRVDITALSDPRQQLKDTSLVCPLCQESLIVVAGLIRIHHFRHKTECSSDYEQHPESYEHLRTKQAVAQQAKEWFSEFTYAKPEFEVPIPEVKRVVDVLFSFPNGWRIACEVQLASITTEQLQKRTEDYARAGIDVLWFIGKAANTPANIKWSIETFGFALEVDYLTTTSRALLTPEPIKL